MALYSHHQLYNYATYSNADVDMHMYTTQQRPISTYGMNRYVKDYIIS